MAFCAFGRHGVAALLLLLDAATPLEMKINSHVATGSGQGLESHKQSENRDSAIFKDFPEATYPNFACIRMPCPVLTGHRF